MSNPTIVLLTLLLLLPGTNGFSQTSTASPKADDPVGEAGEGLKEKSVQSATIGRARNVHRLDDLFFSGQFEKDDIAKLKEQSIARVITLRTDGEIDWDEQAAVEAAGLKFVEVPFRSPETLTDEVFDRVRGLLKDGSQKTLFHCGSASRVGGVWLPYRVLDEGVDLETALKEAKEIGLKTPFIEAKAIDYIKRNQPSP